MASIVSKAAKGRLCAYRGILALRSSPALTQIANITAPGGRRIERPPAWDYRRRAFNLTHFFTMLEATLMRLDENSRVIVIDGPPASGKNEFAKRLAKQLDFKYVPALPDDYLEYDPITGIHLKEFNELLPWSCRNYSLDMFYEDPKPKFANGSGRIGGTQINWFKLRFLTYSDALLHLMSTGQGVVCVRSPWSDAAYAKALFENGYMSKAAMKYYMEITTEDLLYEIKRPNLIIYLDADVQQTKENIKRKNNPLDMKGLDTVLNDSYLSSIERAYKEDVLPQLEKSSELLVYPSIPDITDHEVELMVDDIEALGPMEHAGIFDDLKHYDWGYQKDDKFAEIRFTYNKASWDKHILYDRHEKPLYATETYLNPQQVSVRRYMFDRMDLSPNPETGWLDMFMKELYPPKPAYGQRGHELRKFYIPPYTPQGCN